MAALVWHNKRNQSNNKNIRFANLFIMLLTVGIINFEPTLMDNTLIKRHKRFPPLYSFPQNLNLFTQKGDKNSL